MSSKKEKKRKGEGEATDTDETSIIPRIKIDPAIKDMSVRDAVTQEGLLPINPVELGTEESGVYVGRQAGHIYGSSVYTLAKSVLRDDLPIDKRVRLGLKGFRPLLSMILQATDTYGYYRDIEGRILQEGEGGRKVSAEEALEEIQDRVAELEKENADLKKELEKKRKRRKSTSTTTSTSK